MAKGFFVTATDTGVGKTFVSTLLIGALRRHGLRVGAMKPFETGCEERNGSLLPADGLALRAAAGMEEPVELVTPARYRLPLAPAVSAVEEGRPTELGPVFAAFETLSTRYEVMVVEGIGGVMVPLASAGDAGGSHPFFVTDLIHALKLPAIVVTRPALGTINHTLLTVGRLLDRGITVAGVVISRSTPPDGSVSERTNPDALRQLLTVPVLGVLDFSGHSPSEMPDSVADECLGMPKLLGMLRQR